MASPQISRTLVFKNTSNIFFVAIRSAVAPGNFKSIFFLFAYCSVNAFTSSHIFLCILSKLSNYLSFLANFSLNYFCFAASKRSDA